MKEKLSGARFRWLNEQLYTTPGKHSFSLFQEKPELFDEVNRSTLRENKEAIIDYDPYSIMKVSVIK
jgi:hypothetical protein